MSQLAQRLEDTQFVVLRIVHIMLGDHSSMFWRSLEVARQKTSTRKTKKTFEMVT